jgi:ankyrin repeat protein
VALAGDGDLNGVRALLDQGVDVNAKNSILGDTALIKAAEYDHADVLRLLLARGADINAQGFYGTALTASAQLGHAEIVRILIDKGANVNKGDNKGKTALMKASEVLEKGNITAVDKSFNPIYTPLTAAEEQAYMDIVRMLIAAGAK